MSKCYVNKSLYSIDRDPDWVASYKADPEASTNRWEKEAGIWLHSAEKTSWLSFTDEERRALINYVYESLVAYGAHFFLYLTLFIGIFADDWTEEKGPLSYQLEWARRLALWIGSPTPLLHSSCRALHRHRGRRTELEP